MLKNLPAEILDSHVAVLGKTGVGKSGGIRASIIEPMLDAGERVCCIDPTDTQWGIRLTAEGKPSKYKVIVFGGNHGDRQLSAHEGEAIGEAVGTSSSSVVISTKKMKPRERTEFFTDFAEALLRTNTGVLHLIIDEAHLFAPQSGGMGLGKEAAAMLHATNDLVSLGRGAGLCIVLATQRPAKIHKDSVSQCETLIAMRMSHPLDQAAIEDWIGLKRIKRMKTLPAKYLERAEQIMGGVQFLPDRNAYVWAPDPKIDVFDQIAFPTYKTFDSGERNKAGARMQLTPIDMTALEGKLKQVAEEAEANDPAKLKAEIARLNADLARANKQAAPQDPARLQQAEQRGYAAGHAAGRDTAERLAIFCEKLLADSVTVFGSIEKTATAMIAQIQEPLKTFKSGLPAASTTAAAPTRAVAAPPATTAQRATPSPAASGDGPLTPGALETLKGLAWWAALGIDAPTRKQLGAILSITPSGSTMRSRLAPLSTSALIEYPDGLTIKLTDAGRAAAPAPDMAATLLDTIRASLTDTERETFDAIPPGGQRISHEDIAAALGITSPKGSTMRSRLANLSNRELIHYPGGLIARQDWVA